MTMRYAQLLPGFLQETINQGSLFGTGTKIGTSEVGSQLPETKEVMEVFERKGNKEWLGLLNDFRTFRVEPL